MRIEKSCSARRDGDDERDQHHDDRRGDRQSAQALNVQAQKRYADHEGGQGVTPASHSQASLIQILVCHRSRAASAPAERHRTATRRARASCARQLHEWVDDDPVQDAVEESAFERDQKQAATAVTPASALEAAAADDAIADGVLDAVQIVEDVRRAQELQQSKAGVAGQMDERERVPADRRFRRR